jgi:hypothetical protein
MSDEDLLLASRRGKHTKAKFEADLLKVLIGTSDECRTAKNCDRNFRAGHRAAKILSAKA